MPVQKLETDCFVASRGSLTPLRFAQAHSLIFLMGTHRRLGRDSALWCAFRSGALYDRHLPALIFSFIDPTLSRLRATPTSSVQRDEHGFAIPTPLATVFEIKVSGVGK